MKHVLPMLVKPTNPGTFWRHFADSFRVSYC